MKILQYLQMLRLRFHYLGWLLFFIVSVCGAEPANTLNFEHFSSDEHLSHGTIYAIFQDSQGFIWVGTADGLNRFDSFDKHKKFTQFRHQPNNPYSLSHNTVYSIEEQGDSLWIGTHNGLNRFDRRFNRVIRYQTSSNDANSLSNTEIWSILPEASGDVWIGTANGGLNRLHSVTGEIEHFRHRAQKGSISSDAVWPIYKDSRDYIWVGTDGQGLNRLIKTDTGIVFEHHLHDENVTSLHEDQHQKLWVGTMRGLYHYDPETHDFIQYKLDELSRVWALTSDHEGCLWVGTEGHGLYRIKPDGDTWDNFRHNPSQANSIADDVILKLFTDRAGSIWIGTDKGLDRIDPGYNQFSHYQHHPKDGNSLVNNDVLAILPTQEGELWVGTKAGLSRYNQTRDQVTQYLANETGGLPHKTVRSLYQDSYGTIWVGTDAGYLNRFNPASNDFTQFPLFPSGKYALTANVRSIYQDHSGQLWVGTRHGLYYFDYAQEKLFPHFIQLPESAAYSEVSKENTEGVQAQAVIDNDDAGQRPAVINIFEDSQQRLWVSTLEKGVFCFSKDRSQAPQHYRHRPGHKDSLSSNVITNVLEDQHGTIWISTADSGLNKLLAFDVAATSGGRFLHYREQLKEHKYKGLANDFIQGLLSDDKGYLWLSSYQGISRFDPKAPIEQAFKHYDMADGLQDNVFNAAYAKSAEGELFFGGIKGFNSFFPNDFKTNSYTPPVALTELQISQRVITPNMPDSPLQYTISETDTLHLSHWQNFFNLKFVALNYIQPEKNQYAFRLVGFNNDWQYIKNRQQAFFTKVPPGHYSFQVKASNNEGVWGPINTRLSIIITPPFWLTWWAYMAYFFVLSAIVWKLLTRYRARMRALQQAELDIEINQRKQTEAALHASEERYRLLVEGTESLVVQVDNKGHFLYANPAAETIFAITPQNLIGQSLFEFIHPDDQQASLSALNRWLQEKPSNITFSNRLLSHDREIRHMLWNIQPALNAEGNIAAFNSIAKDVTELKYIEEELRLAKDQAEHASRAKSEFLANMSHEIRTPMNAILGFTDILLNAELELRHKEFLNAIDSSGKSLLKLINDILDLSKVEAGKLSLEYHSTSPRSLFEDIGKIFDHKLSAKQLSFTLEIPDGLPEQLLMDETRVRQVLLNLLGNAVKFTDQGGVGLKVWFDYLDDVKSHIQLSFSVTDTGIGIPEDQQREVFGAFEQQKDQSHAKYGGTGLGLAISKRLVEMMGGIIGLQSKAEHGSTFTVMLNNVKVVHSYSEPQIDTDVLVSTNTQFAPATILIADDVLLNRKLLKFYLSTYPFNLLEAENGEEAVSQAKQHEPDLILMDMKMPVLDGDAATRMLKTNLQLRHIPIVALTALAMKEDEEKIRGLCDGYLSKPVSKQALLQTLALFLPMETEASNTDPNESDAVEKANNNVKIPQALLNTLQTTYLPRVQALNAHSAINDIEALGRELKMLAEQHHCKELLDWANNLLQHTHLFDLAAMHSSLQNFMQMLDEQGNSE